MKQLFVVICCLFGSSHILSSQDIIIRTVPGSNRVFIGTIHSGGCITDNQSGLLLVLKQYVRDSSVIFCEGRTRCWYHSECTDSTFFRKHGFYSRLRGFDPRPGIGNCVSDSVYDSVCAYLDCYPLWDNEASYVTESGEYFQYSRTGYPACLKVLFTDIALLPMDLLVKKAKEHTINVVGLVHVLWLYNARVPGTYVFLANESQIHATQKKLAVRNKVLADSPVLKFD